MVPSDAETLKKYLTELEELQWVDVKVDAHSGATKKATYYRLTAEGEKRVKKFIDATKPLFMKYYVDWYVSARGIPPASDKPSRKDPAGE